MPLLLKKVSVTNTSSRSNWPIFEGQLSSFYSFIFVHSVVFTVRGGHGSNFWFKLPDTVNLA